MKGCEVFPPRVCYQLTSILDNMLESLTLLFTLSVFTDN